MKWLTAPPANLDCSTPSQESLLSIRTIKALSWERLSLRKLLEARDGELSNAKWVVVAGGLVTAVTHTLPWGVLLVTVWFSEKRGVRMPAHQIMILQRIISALLVNVGQISAGLTRLITVPNSFFRIKPLDRKQDLHS